MLAGGGPLGRMPRATCASRALAAGVAFVENFEDDPAGSPLGSPWYVDSHMVNGPLTVIEALDRYGILGKCLLVNDLNFNGKDAGHQTMLVPEGQWIEASDAKPLTVVYWAKPLMGTQSGAKTAEWYIEISLGDVHPPRLMDVGFENESALPAPIPVVAYCKPLMEPSGGSHGQAYFNGKVWKYYGPLDSPYIWQKKTFKISSRTIWMECSCNNNVVTVVRRYLGGFDRISIYTRDAVFSTRTGLDDVSVTGGNVVHTLKVTPETGLSSHGQVGGPFEPQCQSYTLTNTGPAAVNWTGTKGQNWLSVTEPAGTLAGGQLVVVDSVVDEDNNVVDLYDIVGGESANVDVCVNANANTLPLGNHADQAAFTNTAGNDVQTRNVALFVGNVDAYTELFTTNNDLDHASWTLTPDESVHYYAACVTPATQFPTNPAGGAALSLTNDSFVKVTLAQGAQVSLYGTAYSEFYVGSNGYITFGSGDTDASETLADHFAKPRISGLFTDLNPGAGTATWKQLMDRAAVTFENVPDAASGGANSMQIELFYDGRIRLTWLDVAAPDGLAGLSRGTGIPGDYLPSDLTGYGVCPPPSHHQADLDADGDVDLADFGWLQKCLTGNKVLIISPTCADGDFDMDGDVDVSDVGSFRPCLSGPEIAPDAGCLSIGP